MGTGITIALAVGLMIVCIICWLANLFGLPGNWLGVLFTGLYAWLMPESAVASIEYPLVIGMFVLAIIGEIVEFAAGAVGARRAGASRKSTLYSILGSIIGALIGAGVGVPVPIVGPIIAALLFGGLGAAAGAMYGEWTDGREWKENFSIGNATFWGKTIGTMGKFAVGLLIVVAVAIGLLV